MKTAVIAGATGLVGNELLAKLLASSRYEKVVSLARRPTGIHHPKLDERITDFSNLTEALSGVQPDDVFCCLGTTMAKAGSKEKFYQVDFQYPLDLAKATFALGAKQCLLVSALGADKKSMVYYNRVKGEVEEAIRAMDFEAVHIFRPSLLLGERAEKRPGEDTVKTLYKVFRFAIPRKYAAISGGKVAEAMLRAASAGGQGVFIYPSEKMQ